MPLAGLQKMRETFQEGESTEKIRILLVDDHTMFRAGIRVLFEPYRDLQIVGECCGGQEAVRLTRELKPDMLLLDLLLKEGSGMDVLRELREPEAPTKTIMLTACIERNQIVEVIQLGARGIVLKELAFDLLVKAIRCVMTGQYWVDRGRISDLAETLFRVMRDSASPARSAFGMTPRERQIVAAVLSGYTNRGIAQKLSISDQTVKNHLTAIYNKIGVSNRLELALCASKHNLTAGPLA